MSGRIAALVALAAAALATPAQAELPRPGSSKLLLTGGVSSIDGAAGGGLTPWAVTAGYAAQGEIGAKLRIAGDAVLDSDSPLPQKAHDGMDIRRGDFNALVEVLQQSMDAQGITFGAQNRLLAQLAPMHRDIVNTP
jgi:hypothetical protein